MKRFFDALHLGGHIRANIAATRKNEVRHIHFFLKGFTLKKRTVLVIK
jgi:hypothetical protein